MNKDKLIKHVSGSELNTVNPDTVPSKSMSNSRGRDGQRMSAGLNSSTTSQKKDPLINFKQPLINFNPNDFYISRPINDEYKRFKQMGGDATIQEFREWLRGAFQVQTAKMAASLRSNVVQSKTTQSRIPQDVNSCGSRLNNYSSLFTPYDIDSDKYIQVKRDLFKKNQTEAQAKGLPNHLDGPKPNRGLITTLLSYIGIYKQTLLIDNKASDNEPNRGRVTTFNANTTQVKINMSNSKPVLKWGQKPANLNERLLPNTGQKPPGSIIPTYKAIDQNGNEWVNGKQTKQGQKPFQSPVSRETHTHRHTHLLFSLYGFLAGMMTAFIVMLIFLLLDTMP